MTPEEKLAHFAKVHPVLPDRFWFSHPMYVHTAEQALAIIETCGILGVPVTDVIGSNVWLRIADWLAHLDERVSRLEKK